MASNPSSQQLNAQHLVLCAGTVTGASFEELVAAARAGGFDAISLFPTHYRQARAAGASDADLRLRLADNGLCIAELDPLLNWVPGHEFPADAGMGLATEDEFYRMADALGARSLNVVWALPQRIPEELLAEAFAAVCNRAAQHGLLAHIEFLPWAQVDSVEAALRIVRLADRPNGGILFDSWHHFRSRSRSRSRIDNAALAMLPDECVQAIQLNDAPALAEENLVEETMQRRLLPGEGDIALVEIIRALDAAGCNAPLGIEVFSTALQKLAPVEIGRIVGDNLRALRRQAR
jgi:sugar phosphate isomerase/epimerase